jgi:hypothetical protein
VNREIYATITNRFIEKLKQGIVPWQKPWLDVQNLVSRKPYHGINALLLGSSEFKSPFWLSFKQALDLGGHVKKGERSTPVIYYKFLEKTITDSVRSLVQMFSMSTRRRASRRQPLPPVKILPSLSKEPQLWSIARSSVRFITEDSLLITPPRMT